jgi:hypothetical protein
MKIVQRWLGGVVLGVALLLLPAAATAAEFSLGGFIAMYAIWDSTQVNSNLSQPIARDNDPNNQHGRLKLSAERTRMNFTIKGPEVWGARTTGFIEWDFDGGGNEYIITAGAAGPGGGWASTHKARVRVRHLMFRLNWPETELLLGQYWSLLSEDGPEAAKPGTSGIPGMIWFREPQIRLSQKFLGVFNAAVAIANPLSGPDDIQLPTDQSANNNPYLGQSSETPRLTGRLKYEQDLWGKAAYYGVPQGFSARVAVAWQRSRFRSFTGQGLIFGQNHYTTITVSQGNQQYLNPWVVQGSLFVPLITTQTPNLARTMSLLTQWYVGQGLDLEKEAQAANSSYLDFDTVAGGTLVGTRKLAQKFGGFVQLQYYFTNQWFANVIWGMNRVYGVDRNEWLGTTTSADPAKFHQHYYATLWYRPIQALKFGLEYTYARTDYFQKVQAGNNTSDFGEDHRLLFVGFFFF